MSSSDPRQPSSSVPLTWSVFFSPDRENCFKTPQFHARFLMFHPSQFPWKSHNIRWLWLEIYVLNSAAARDSVCKPFINNTVCQSALHKEMKRLVCRKFRLEIEIQCALLHLWCLWIVSHKLASVFTFLQDSCQNWYMSLYIVCL